MVLDHLGRIPQLGGRLILAVGVYDGKVGVESEAGAVEIGPGQFAYLDPATGMPRVLSEIPWVRAGTQTMNPADETQWQNDSQMLIDESLGIPGGGEGCECQIVF